MDPHIIKTIKVKKFNSSNKIHLRLAQLSQDALKITKKIIEDSHEDLITNLNNFKE